MNVDVSVVVVTYNSRSCVATTIDSLIAHTAGVSHEIIVVDNASPDATADFIAAQYPSLRLVRRAKNDGLSAAINDGVAGARGTYIAVLNPDVRFVSDVLTPLVAYLREHADAGIVAPKLLNEDGSVQLSCRSFPGYSTALFNRYSLLTRVLPRNRYSSSYLMSEFGHDTLSDVDWVSGAALMLPRAIFDEVGGWDAGFFMFNEDVDLCRRVRNAGYRVVYDPSVSVFHAIGVSTSASPRMVIERHKSMWRYYRKHLRGGFARDAITAAGIAARCTSILGANAVRRLVRRQRSGSAIDATGR